MSSATLPFTRVKQFLAASKKGNNLWKSSFYIMISQSVSVVLFLLADALFARRFSSTDFATWKQLTLLINLGVPLISFGLPEGFKYFAAKEPENVGTHLLKTLLATTIITVAIFSFMWLGGVGILSYQFKNPKVAYFRSGIALIFFCVTFSKLIRYYLINHELTNILFNSALLCLSVGIIQLSLAYYFYGDVGEQTFWYWITSLVCLIFLSSVITVFFRQRGELFKLKNSSGSLFNFSPYLKIGLPLYIASFIGILTLNLDKAIVNKLGTLNDFAVYSIGAIEIPIFSMISASVSQSIFPKLVTFYSNNDTAPAKKLWVETTRKISLITYPIILVLMLFAAPLVKLVFTEKYEAAVPIFKAYLLVSLWRNSYYGALISASGRTKWITVYSVISLVLNVGLSIGLYFYNGLLGIAYGAFCAASVTALLQLWHEKMLGLWFKQVIANKLVLLLIVLILIAYLKPW